MKEKRIIAGAAALMMTASSTGIGEALSVFAEETSNAVTAFMSHSEVIKEGVLNDTVTYKLYSDGTLEFGGNGYIDKDISVQSDDVVSITFADSCSGNDFIIEAGAFENYYNLEELNLPSLENDAFGCYTSTCSTADEDIADASVIQKMFRSSFDDDPYCFLPNLKKIRILGGTNIAQNAFAFVSGTRNIIEVELPDSVTEIGRNAFYSSGCKITQNSSVLEMICENAFKNYRLSEAPYFPESLKVIERNAFENTFFESVTIPENVDRIEDEAFKSSTIKKITITNSDIKLGKGIFEKCEMLEELTLPSLENNVFGYCTFANSTADKDMAEASVIQYLFRSSFDDDPNCFLPNLKKIRILGGSDIAQNAFAFVSGTRNTIEVELPDSVTEIGRNAFYSSGCKITQNSSGLKMICENAFKNYRLSEAPYFPESLEKIERNAFENTFFESITIPENVGWIEDEAFKSSTITKFTITNSDIRLGKGIFEKCEMLEELNLPSLENDVFGYCTFTYSTADKDIAEASVIQYLFRSSFDDDPYCFLPNLKKIRILGGSDIAQNAFAFVTGTRNTIEVELPDSVLEIGRNAFYSSGCKITQNSSGLETICENAFKNYRLSEAPYFPESLEKIERNAFENTFFESITIPENVEWIEDEAFKSSTIKKFTITNSDIRLGKGILEKCEMLEELNLPSLENDAFGYCTFTYSTADKDIAEASVIQNLFRSSIDDDPYCYLSNLKIIRILGGTNIAQNAFAFVQNKTGSIEVILPDSIETIGTDAFISSACTTAFKEETNDPEEIIYGDLDKNGIVDLTDLSYLSLYLLGDVNESKINIKAADVTADDEIDIRDLATLKQYVCKDPKAVLGPRNK